MPWNLTQPNQQINLKKSVHPGFALGFYFNSLYSFLIS